MTDFYRRREVRMLYVKATLFLALALSASSVMADIPLDTSLRIPPLLVPTYSEDGVGIYEMTAMTGAVEFLEGLTTRTMGYSGDYLGPTIRVRNGERVEIRIRNALDEMTTVHWHGLYVPAESDGGPHQTIEPDQSWTASFTVRQQAATLWYHPHPMDKTGIQVYNGLSGLFIIDDENSDALGLPSVYGVDDIPIIIQDRRFSADGQFAYVQGMPDVMHGIAGEVLLINGTRQPVASIPQGVVRLRILNGSDANVFRVRFAGDTEYLRIGSDGGFLNESIEENASIIATGERIELLIDASGYADGEVLSFLVDDYFGRTFDAMSFRIDASISATVTSLADLPARMNTLIPVDPSEFEDTRTFAMQTMGPGGQLTINGRHMELDRIDFRLNAGTREIWEISNPAMGMMAIPHTFHIHNGQFRLLEINGEPPPPELSGRKDTFLLWPRDRIRVAVAFEDYTGIYMYHCHFLVHEDAGMMGQFEIF
jgi:blue copper oxidase